MPDEDAGTQDAENQDGATQDGATQDAATGSSRPQSTRRPTAAASAASRARRIGGARPQQGPTPASQATADDGQPSTTPKPSTTPVSTEKKRTVPAGETASTDEVATGSDDGTKDKRAVLEIPAWLRWIPAGVLAACAVAMLVIILVAGHGVWYSKPSSSAVRDRVLAAAQTCIAATNTYDYQTIPSNEKQGLACTTGKYSGQYRRAITRVVTPAATKLKASQSVQINKAGIENISSDGHQWTVLLYGQTKISQAGKKTRIDPFSAEAFMQEVGGKWLIMKIDTVESPGS